MKPARFETFIVIGNMAYNIDRLPWYKRWKIKIKQRLGIHIDAL